MAVPPLLMVVQFLAQTELVPCGLEYCSVALFRQKSPLSRVKHCVLLYLRGDSQGDRSNGGAMPPH